MQNVQVLVRLPARPGAPPLPLSYPSTALVSEFVRNVCVNAGIDPDTVAGVTRNVEVTVGDVVLADPLQELWQVGLEAPGPHEVVVRELGLGGPSGAEGPLREGPLREGGSGAEGGEGGAEL